MKLLLISLLHLFFSTKPNDRLVNWEVSSVKSGKDTEIRFKGKIKQGWYIYSSELKVVGPLETDVTWAHNKDYELLGDLIPIKPKKKHDPVWEGTVHYFENDAQFAQKIKLLKPGTIIRGTIAYQACINDPEDGQCVNEEFIFKVQL